MEAAKSAATGFLSTLRQGLVSGEGWWKSFGNAALSVLDKIASAIETQLVNALFTPSAGGFNLLSLLGIGGGVAAGGLSGGAADGAAGASAIASAAPVAKMAARLPAVRSAANNNAQGPGGHVTAEVSVNQDGNWEAKVTNIADKSAGRMGQVIQASHTAWKKNGLHNDIEDHLKNRRKIG